MLTYVEGSLFTSPAQVLVNTVNTVGIMGKGIAKEFKAIYPEMFREYQEFCRRGEFTIGTLLLYRTPHKWILNFPTKRHWKGKSRLEDIDIGLAKFVERYQELGIFSIAFPQLGCGNGQLDWESQVRPVMERYLANLPIDSFVHIHAEHSAVPSGEDASTIRAWLKSESSFPSFEQVWGDLATLIQSAEVTNWEIVGDGNAAALRQTTTDSVVDRTVLLDLWRQLHTFGYLATRDVACEWAESAGDLLDLLHRLRYVRSTRLLSIPTNERLAGHESVSILLGKTAPGLQIAPTMDRSELQPEISEESKSGVETWSANTTMRRLPLFSTP